MQHTDGEIGMFLLILAVTVTLLASAGRRNKQQFEETLRTGKRATEEERRSVDMAYVWAALAAGILVLFALASAGAM